MKKYLNSKQLAAFPQLYKINLLNSISGYKSESVIGTKCNKQIVNVSSINSVSYYSFNPVVIGVTLRLTKPMEKVYRAITETGCFTINAVDKKKNQDLYQVNGNKIIINRDKDLKVEKVYKKGFYAPYIKGAPLQVGMNFLEVHHLKVNQTVLVLGEIVDLYFKKSMLSEYGFFNPSKERVSTVKGLIKYLRNYPK